MSPRIYCHIGLPKTATTTLQLDYFPYVDHSKYVYLGVAQPRGESESDALFKQVLTAVNTGEGIKAASKALQSQMRDKKKSLILSEEMLTVSVAGLEWQEKLSRLKDVIQGADFRLLITIREPVSAMFSFYLELYSRFKGKGEEFSHLAKNNNDFQIYHYDNLLSVVLPLFGKENVWVNTFEDLVNDDYEGVKAFLDFPEMESGFSELRKNNVKKRTGNAVYVPVRMRLKWVTKIYQLLGGSDTIVGRMLRSLGRYPVDKLRKINYRHVAVPALSDDDQAKLKETMSQTMNVLSEQFGVKY